MRIIINESQLDIIRGCLLNESYNDNHIFYDYLSDYDVSYVFNEFRNNPSGKEGWLPLIDPNMYYKALCEYSKYGRLVKFPSRYVYQWMGIIMRNTAILVANTEISGHSSQFPIDDCYEFLESWFNDGRYIDINASDDVILELNVKEVYNICNNGKLNEAIDSRGQEYFSFMNQSDVNNIEKNDDIARFKNVNKLLISMVDKYNNKDYNHGKIEIDYNNKRFLWHCDVYSLLDDLGIYDWMSLPDGSDGWSDFGIEPLCKIINEYNEDLEPEKVLVLVNRCLDVYHQRGDLSSIFIKGGSNSLNRISGVN